MNQQMINEDKKTNNLNEDEKDKSIPPGAPDRTPVEDPSKTENPPMGDPQPPEKKPRLRD